MMDGVLYGGTSVGPSDGMLAWGTLSFTHPFEVAASPMLGLEEKREILASWASDACAVDSAPALRQYPGTDRPVEVDEILAALCALDSQADLSTGPETGGEYLRVPLMGAGSLKGHASTMQSYGN